MGLTIFVVLITILTELQFSLSQPNPTHPLINENGNFILQNQLYPKSPTFLHFQVSDLQINQLTPSIGDDSSWSIHTDPANVLHFQQLQSRVSDSNEFQFIWKNAQPTFIKKEVCFPIKATDKLKWYSLFLGSSLNWPLNLDETAKSKQSFGTFTLGDNFQPMLETILLNTDGFALIFDELHPWSVSSRLEKGEPVLCFSLQANSLYPTSIDHPRAYFTLKFRIVTSPNIRKLHQALIQLGYIQRPTQLPEVSMFNLPLWSNSVVKYFSDYSTLSPGEPSQLLGELFKKCLDNFLVKSGTIVDVEESWQKVRGSFIFDEAKYNPSKLTDKYTKGFIPALEISPTVQHNSAWADEHNDSTFIDFTQPSNRLDLMQKLHYLKNSTSISTFKLLGGKVGDFVSKSTPAIQGNILVSDEITQKYPNFISTQYTSTVSQIVSPSSSYSIAYKSQGIPLFLRFEIKYDYTADTDSATHAKDAFRRLFVNALTLSMAGYQFLLPEHVHTIAKPVPSREWFLRWTQATLLLPGLYFTIPPWAIPTESTDLSTVLQRLIGVRTLFSNEMSLLANEWILHGSPIVRPIWYAAPEGPKSYDIWDQFMLGENILVAPIVTLDSTERSVYFPPGNWIDTCTGQLYIGPSLIDHFTVDLYSLLLFVRKGSVSRLATTKLCHLDVKP